MWRLVVFIVVFAVFLVFITFNLENKCDISFGFTKIKDVPVFLTIFVSFIAGLFCALPLVMLIKHKKHKKEIPEKNHNIKVDNKLKMTNGNPSDGGIHAL